MLSVNKIAVIHIAKQQVGMTDSEYDSLLGSFKVKSSKELSPRQFGAVMDRFKALGFTNKFNKKHRKVTGSIMEKLDAIRLDMKLSWAYIDGIVKKQFKNIDGQPVEKFEWLNNDEKFKVLQMLIMHQRRKQRGKGGGGGGDDGKTCA